MTHSSPEVFVQETNQFLKVRGLLKEMGTVAANGAFLFAGEINTSQDDRGQFRCSIVGASEFKNVKA